MRLNAVQAAAKLGCSKDTVAKLVKAGKLTDHGVTKEGHERHHFQIENKEIVELAKVFKPHRRLVSQATMDAVERAHMLETSHRAESVASNGNAPGWAQRIEAKLDLLLRMWR